MPRVKLKINYLNKLNKRINQKSIIHKSYYFSSFSLKNASIAGWEKEYHIFDFRYIKVSFSHIFAFSFFNFTKIVPTLS
jgi:hypothetical protein